MTRQKMRAPGPGHGATRTATLPAVASLSLPPRLPSSERTMDVRLPLIFQILTPDILWLIFKNTLLALGRYGRKCFYTECHRICFDLSFPNNNLLTHKFFSKFARLSKVVLHGVPHNSSSSSDHQLIAILNVVDTKLTPESILEFSGVHFDLPLFHTLCIRLWTMSNLTNLVMRGCHFDSVRRCARMLTEALGINESITSLDLKDNRLGDEGWCAIFNGLRNNQQNKIKVWDLSGQKDGINPTIAKSLAAYVAVSGSITSVCCPPGVELIHCPSCFLILLLEYNTNLTLSWRSIVSAA